MSLVCLSITGGSLTISFFAAAIVVTITVLATLISTVGNEFIKSFLSNTKEEILIQKIKVLARTYLPALTQ